MREGVCRDHAILVGRKGVARYVLAGLYKVFVEKCSTIKYSALGKSIYRAVAAAEALSRLLGFVYVKRVQISSIIVSEEGRTRRISRIEILMSRMDEEP